MSSFLEKYAHNLPVMDFSIENGVFQFSGISNIENATAFEPTFNSIERYLLEPKKETIIICKFDYFNTATSRLLMEMFETFEKAYNKGNDIKVKWHYSEQDIDMKDSGKLYEELCDLPFEFIIRDEK